MKIDTAVKVRSTSQRTARQDASHLSQYGSAVRRLKQSTYLPSTLRHQLALFFSLYLPHSLAMLLYEVSLCHAGLGIICISMHITDQPHVGDINTAELTLSRFDHAVCIPFAG